MAIKKYEKRNKNKMGTVMDIATLVVGGPAALAKKKGLELGKDTKEKDPIKRRLSKMGIN